VDWLEQTRTAFSQRRRGQHADRAAEHGCLIAEDVAEEVAGEQHVELARVAHQLHRRVVDIHVAEVHARVAGGMECLHSVAPELAHIEHIGLVHAAELAAPLLGLLEAHLGDPVDLVVAVGHGVEGALTGVGLQPALGGAEIHAAGELAHHQQIHPLDHLTLEGGGLDQRRDDLHRPQVGEQAQAGPQPQQAGFGALLAGQAVVAGGADGGQQHRIAAAAGLQRAGRQGFTGGIDGRAAHGLLVVAERNAVAAAHRIKQLAGHRRDLRADPIAGEQGDPVERSGGSAHSRSLKPWPGASSAGRI
jgi:hypothetical protein